jgi:hypothetical protein
LGGDDLSESQAQQEERVHHHLVEARKRIEQDIAETSDSTLRRIEVDAAAVVTLSLVSELLPQNIRLQVQGIIDLHETIWSLDTPPIDNATPRKPLGQRLIRRFAFFLRSADERKGRTRNAHDFLQPLR